MALLPKVEHDWICSEIGSNAGSTSRNTVSKGTPSIALSLFSKR